MKTSTIRWIFCALGFGCLTACNTPQRIEKAETEETLSFRESDWLGKRTGKHLPVVVQHGVRQGTLVISREWESGDHIKDIDLKKLKMISRTNTIREKNGKVLLDFIIRVPRPLAEQDWDITVTPTVERDGCKSTLKPVRVKGHVNNNYYNRKDESKISGMERNIRENRQLYGRRSFFVTSEEKKKQVHTSVEEYNGWEDDKRRELLNFRIDTVNGHRTWEYYYTQEVDVSNFERILKIYFDAELENMGHEKYSLQTSDTLIFHITSLSDLCDGRKRYIMLENDSVYNKQLRAELRFMQGKATFDRHDPANAGNLKKLKDEISHLSREGELTLQQITLAASCSPEGRAEFNDNLSRSRGHTIKKWLILNKITPPNGISVNTLSENWPKLKSIIQQTEMEHQQELLEIIDGIEDKDIREREIRKRYPDEYIMLYNEVYPRLREVILDCKIKVEGVKSYTPTEAIDEDYMRALSWLQQRHYKKALAVLEKYKDINTAICYLCLEQNAEAKKTLSYLSPTANVMYLLAIANQRLKLEKEAVVCLLRSYELDETLRKRSEEDSEIKHLLLKFNIK